MSMTAGTNFILYSISEEKEQRILTDKLVCRLQSENTFLKVKFY